MLKLTIRISLAQSNFKLLPQYGQQQKFASNGFLGSNYYKILSTPLLYKIE